MGLYNRNHLGYEVGDKVAIFWSSRYDNDQPMLGEVIKISDKAHQLTVKITHGGDRPERLGRILRFNPNGLEVGNSDYGAYGWRLWPKSEQTERYESASERYFARNWRATLREQIEKLMNGMNGEPTPEERDMAIRRLFEIANEMDGKAALRPGPIKSLDELFADYERELEEKSS